MRARDAKDDAPTAGTVEASVLKPISKGINMDRSIRQRLPHVGHVYIIEAGGRTKIGKSQTPESRIKAIRTSAGVEIDKIFITPLHENHGETEKAIHATFQQDRKQGEWFAASFDAAVAAAEQLVVEPISQARIDVLLADVEKRGEQLVNTFKAWHQMARGFQ